MKKKFLIFAVMIFIIALGAVSAHDIDDSAVVSYESQNADGLSALTVDDVETADILQTDSNSQILALDENKSVDIVVNQEKNRIKVSVVDNDGIYMHEGSLSFISENGEQRYESLWNDYVSFNLYDFDVAGYPQNILIEYYCDGYLRANCTFYAEGLTDSIVASDVVDENSFSATFLDYSGNPLNPFDVEEAYFQVYNGDKSYYQDYFARLNSEGVAVINTVLPVDNYTVYVENTGTGQRKYYWWNMTKEDENKRVNIVASQSDGKLIVSAVDCNGNNLTRGTFYFTSENGQTRTDYLYDDYSTSFSLYRFDLEDFPQDILIKFVNNEYYPANLTIHADKFVDSIIASDVVDEFSFNATFFDYSGNPLNRERVTFYVSDSNNFYHDTFDCRSDSEGRVVFDPALPVGNYTVSAYNGVTQQTKSYQWNLSEVDESKHVKILASQSVGNLIVSAVDGNGNNVTRGEFIITFKEGDMEYYFNLNDEPFISANLYEYLGENYPQNISIKFFSDYYYPANSTFYVESLPDSIVASDVVDEFSFSATFFDTFGNPSNSYASFEIFDQTGSNRFYLDHYTDSLGRVTINPALPIGNYTVKITNYVTYQTMSYWWNISKVDENRFVNIVAYQKGGYLIVAAVDKDGNNVTSGEFFFTSEKGGREYDSLGGDSFCVYSLYGFGIDNFPQNITIKFSNLDYYPANLTIHAGTFNDSLVACDVVDEYSFNATFFDGYGNPLNNTQVEFSVYNDGSYLNNLWPVTDSNGVVVLKIPLHRDNYTVWAYNRVTGQSKNYDWNITKEYESRIASINVTREKDKYRFIINVVDKDGNPIGDDLVEVWVKEDYGTVDVEVHNGTAIFDYLSNNYDEGLKNLVFTLKSDYYYPVDTTSSFTFKDTINATESRGTKFNATFTDINGNPLKNHDVAFILYENEKLIENITVKTDEKGFASIEKDIGRYYGYDVIVKNLDTYQEKQTEWINKKQFEITLDALYYDDEQDIYYTDNDTVLFKISPDATGTLYLSSYPSHYPSVKLPVSEFNLTLFRPTGDYVYVSYQGDENYSRFYDAFKISVKQFIIPNMTISENLTVDYGDEINFTVSLRNDTDAISNASVEIMIGNETFNLTTDENGNITLPIDMLPGVYDVSVIYAGSTDYRPLNKTTTLTINKLDSEVSVNKTVLDYGEKLIVNVNEGARGNITVEINGKRYEANINNSKAEVDLNNLGKGNYTAKLTYSGDDFYNNCSIDENITVNSVEISDFNVTSNPVDAGEAVEIEVQLPEDATGNVTATVDGKTYSAPVIDGKATISIPDLAYGNYTVPVNYSGDDKYDAIAKSVNVTVNEDKSDIIKAPDVTKYFKGSERFVVTVTDYEGNPIANKSVSIVINGQNYDRTTNANGTTSIGLGLNSGVYNATVAVDNKTINSVITILPTVNGTDVVKVYRNATQYYATFRDSQGNYLKEGTVVTFNINGVMYERKISSEGIAKLNLNLEQGTYVLTAMNPETGENAANNITIIPRIIENRDITKYYRNATQYTVKVLGDDGKAVGAGETVTFNINGVFYTRSTNASGIAKLNLNLQPDDYIITAEYKNCKVSNNIKILPVLSAEDISMKYRDGTQFVATLVDGQGKPLANEKVEFNINGVFYYRYTDSRGQAKLNINLQAGQYIITSSYNGANIANTVTISA